MSAARAGRRVPRRGHRTTRRLLADLDTTDDIVVVADLDGNPRWWNRSADGLLHRGDRTVALADVVAGGQDAVERMVSHAATGRPWTGEVELVAEDGSRLPCWASVVPHLGWRRRPTGFTLSARDISDHRRRADELAREVLRDGLTGLPSRALLEERLAHMIGRLERSGRHGALLVVDIDRFRVVNDSLGREHGDEVIRLVADRLRSRLPDADTVARTAGDEFIVLVDDLGRADQAGEVAEGLLAELGEPLELGRGTVVVSASIGVARVDADRSPDEVLEKAHQAMQRAKNRGGARYAVLDEDPATGVDRRLRIEWALRERLEDGRIELRFQPVVDLVTGAMVFAAGRFHADWPQLGDIDAAEVMQVADDAGLGPLLLHRMASTAAELAAGWPDGVGVSVPASPLAVVAGDLAEVVVGACSRAGIHHDRVLVEVTEAAFLDDPVRTAEEVGRLRSTGVRIALGDFGTGVSSLAMLRSVPVDLVELDRALLDDLDSDSTRAVVGAILGVAEVLGLAVAAVGVDTEHHLVTARSLGCGLARGRRLGGPVPAGDLDQWFSAVPAGD